MKMVENFSKDYYIKKLQEAGEYLKQKAEDILLDFDTDRIHEIDISINLSIDKLTTVNVNKEYIPILIEKEEK